ncbi:HlyD family type I secretion periplasmic adaptor subunit [Chitiniphilus purpureus]|uniref:HlyD family type I secretion periplasmic adaptor subunit n=1 Tax=Chitiniphilus purpureus TaxID=2981137 RepID=UPI0027E4DF1C|nr:HlyD family type I secretion periplasmic adaptor subunit [Chitiniphilus sp. CD1]
MRHHADPPDRLATERAFLPAALELQESPPHPAARLTLWLLLAFLTLTVLWACLGKIDIVAVAPGKLVVSNQSKVVQPLEPGVITAIHVRDGQHVRAGQLLIELDATLARADASKHHSAWLDARLDQRKAQALLAALAAGAPPILADDPQLHRHPDYAVRRTAKQAEMHSSWQELQARLATLDAATTQKQAEYAATQAQVRKLEQTLPLMQQREADFKDLAAKNFISKHGYLDKEQARIETEQDLASQRNTLKQLDAAILANRQQREATRAEFRRAQHDALARVSEQAHAYGQDVIKAERLQRQTRLTAPVDGVVQQLAVHTVGGVVTEAQPLLVVVPHTDQVEAEVVLENKDIGFVNAGQLAAVKVETFNYTRYGLLDGQVATVTRDAIPDEKLGLIYQARVKLARRTMNIDGKTLPLAPGMAVTAEIKTGQRRVIEYFLSPLIQHATESVRER